MSDQSAAPSSGSSRGLARREALTGYLWISPWILGFVVFTAGPMLISLYVSMTRFSFGSSTRFIGLQNYWYALTRDPLIWSALGRTVYYTALVVTLGVIGSLLAAMLLNQGLRGTSIYRTMFFIPSLTPVVAVAIIWAWILAPSLGPVDQLLSLVGVDGPRWFSQPNWAILGIIIIVLWSSVGGGRMIIFLAGLQGVPQELSEAAEIDGANAWQKFRHVTVPLITPVIFFNVILGIIFSFQVFDIAYVVSTAGTPGARMGGPGEATYFYALHIYQKAFRDFDFGYSAALAWILFLILIVFTQVQFRAAARWVHYEGERT